MKELNDYIVLSRSNNIPDKDTESNLLSKGWKIEEIEEAFFVLSGGDKSQLKHSLENTDKLKRKGVYASISLISSFAGAAFILFLGFTLLGTLLVILGIIFGFMGIKSNKKSQAYIGLILSFIVILYIGFCVFIAFNLIKYNKNFFTGEIMTDQQIMEKGVSEQTLKTVRGERN